ncbi:MAG: hypothetical protein H0W01_07000 [Pseudonocardiales bacterium]|nr:hypothetical protein [Pseudonocardiales bacterium]
MITGRAVVTPRARGMLINTLVALRLPDHVDEDPAAAELVRYCLDAPPLAPA